MKNSGFHARGIGLASLIAGPVFLLSALLAELYGRIPAPIVIRQGEVFAALILCLPAAGVGLIIALPANAIGTAVMVALSKRFPPARTRGAWALVGGGAGGVGAWMIEPPSSVAFALVFTSALCASLCGGVRRAEMG